MSKSGVSYAAMNQKSWGQVLADNQFLWRPPFTVHLPIQPVHAPDFIHVDSALNVSRQRVFPGLNANDPAWHKVKEQETFLIQFAFDDPPFVPDFHLSRLGLAEGKYPLATAQYFAWDLLYQWEYFCCPIEESQSLLWIRGSVTNEGDTATDAHVWIKVNFQRECDVFDYHYAPFYWDAGKLLPCDKVSLRGELIQREEAVVGKIAAEDFTSEWINEVTFAGESYNQRFACSRPYFVVPHLRITRLDHVIHLRAKVRPSERKQFSLAILTNFEAVTPAHLEYLRSAEAVRGWERSIEHFRSCISESKADLICPQGNWDRIFMALQLSTLQLLVKFPDGPSLMPTQGGSSERHFVWIWEAILMLMPMLPLGHFKPVRRVLDFMFSLQDGGCPPEGRFTTTAGAIGSTGPKWMNATGSALALAADYYRYSHDDDFLKEFLPRILRAGQWIIGELRGTRRLNADGSRPLHYGLMPFGCGTDGDIGYIIAFTDAYTFWGLEKATCLLEKLGHEQAAEFRRELEAYRADLATAIGGLVRPDGYIERAIRDHNTVMERKFEAPTSAIHLAYTRILDITSDIGRRFMAYFEEHMADDVFLGPMDRDVAYMGTAEWIAQHLYLQLGQWKKAFLAVQTYLKYGMSQDTFQVQERFSKTNPAYAPWQPNGSGNGKILDMILKSFYFDSDGVVTLFGGIPFLWLVNNKTTRLGNLHTTHGILSLQARMLDEATCHVQLKGHLPRNVKFPDHFDVRPESSSVLRKSDGLFEMDESLTEAVFILRSTESLRLR